MLDSAVGAPSTERLSDTLRVVAGLLGTSVTLYLALALYSYSAADPGFSSSGALDASVSNWMGRSGAWLADWLFAFFGVLAWFVPVILGMWSLGLLRHRLAWPGGALAAVRCAGGVGVLVGGVSLAALHAGGAGLPAGGGGMLGGLIAATAGVLLGSAGLTLFAMAVLLAGACMLMGLPWWLALVERIGARTTAIGSWLARRGQRLVERVRHKREVARQVQARRAVVQREQKKVARRPKPRIASERPAPQPGERAEREKQAELFEDQVPSGTMPSLDLLEAGTDDPERGFSDESLAAMSRLLELKLADFNVEAEVVSVQPGPVVTRFEIQPAAGVKVSRITGLVKDLARSLAVISVRVVEVIPGKSVVGIEIPNEVREIVRFREIVASRTYEKANSPLTLALGHDIAGHAVVADLGRMPHLLVAGTTGSGKSVGVNSMLLSLLYRATPEEVRLILVDPKMLELSVYEGIPHLLTPVVTDMKDAAAALRWCVAEMERRYRLMATMGVRNVAGYNRKVQDGIKAGQPLTDPLWRGNDDEEPPLLHTLPFIVVVIDEFADMMMIVGKKVEELIARIAQKARAAGIHLILATQRPSVDVITGLIKANIPSRISFQVSSKVDSRTILDQGGAEQLLGHGDMLYLPPGTAVPTRVHGAFVSDDEVHRVVADWKRRGAPDYLEEVLTGGSSDESDAAEAGGDVEQDDALYDEAVAYVLESRRASISSVQRKLRIGYNRAARLVEAMEAAGVVSSMSGSGNREVLAPGGPE